MFRRLKFWSASADRQASLGGPFADWTDPGIGVARNPALEPGLDHQIEMLKPPRTKRWWIKRVGAALIALLIIVFLWLAVTAPLSKSLEPVVPPEITLLAANGEPIARKGAVVEAPIVVDRLPAHVVEAFLAIEDRRFYSHWGIDPRGLLRAVWANATDSGITQGGSTITQQLAKISFLTPERSLSRKAREMLIAFWLEAWLTKDEILGRYLSNAYFGDNVYGLRAASLHYFYRQPERLAPEQAILLAGLVQAPSRFAPTRNPQGARKRALIVRQAMVDAGFLTAREARALPDARLDVRARPTLPNGTYFADWAIPQARALSEQSYSRVTLTTTLDARLQKAAERTVARAGLGKSQIALVAMRPTGEVVAMVGGRSYSDSSFNRATQARRQPGSTFKLFVWLAALQNGMDADTKISDTPIETGSYRPKNAGDRYRGEITLRDAFVHSSNVAAVKLFEQVGSDAVISEARKLGLTGTMEKGDSSLALGTSSTTLLEMTAAYASIAANRWPVKPTAFKREQAGWFDWLVDRPRRYSKRVHSEMEDMLRGAINRGTGQAAQLSIANFGKTGTSQDNRDALFIGYAGDLVVGVWVGNDDNSPMRGVKGGGLPAQIWRDFMGRAIPGAVQQSAPKPQPPAEEIGDIDIDLQALEALEGIDGQISDTRIEIDEGQGVTLSTRINGEPVAVTVDDKGPRVIRSEPRQPAPPQQ